MADNNCGQTTIIPDNNQVSLQDVNQIITVTDNNCCTTIDVTQPITQVVQVLTGPMGAAGAPGTLPESGSLNLTGSIDVSGSISSDLFIGGVFSGSFIGPVVSASITYVSASIDNPLSQIEVADFDSNVAVTYVDGRLKFVFGTPTLPSTPTASFNGTFITDRFNQVSDDYIVTGDINVGAYTLISASIFENDILLAQVGGNSSSVIYNTTTTGSHTYTFEVTASSPLDGSINTQSTVLAGILNKINPGNPTITPTPTLQLGGTSNQIEQGATGSILFTSSSGATNSWVHNYTSTNVESPIYVTGSATGSTSISATVTSYYSSSGVDGSDNNPALTTTTSNSFTYTKIRSLRYGASTDSSYTQPQLEVLSNWDTTLGGTVGKIAKGTTTASGQTLTITWTGDKYHYIVYNSALANLTNITTAGFGVLNAFTLTTVGNYKIYKSNTLQAGGSGTSITYVLT